MNRGTYVAVKPLPWSKILLSHWIRDSKIEHPEPLDDLHITVLYSRTEIDAKCNPTDRYHCVPMGFKLLDQPDGTYLVLLLASPSLTARHNALIASGGTHDYDEFLVHVTLSRNAAGVDIDSLPYIDMYLSFSYEYSEPLDLT